MSYLRLLEDKIQNVAEDISATLNIDVTVVDDELVRVGGTGKFHYRIYENSPQDSIFAKILRSGEPEWNKTTKDSHVCQKCSNYFNCEERGNMTYPIKVEGQNIGVVSFAAFNSEQKELMLSKCDEYLAILQQVARTIEIEVLNIKNSNRLNMKMAEINEIINLINKEIIIINSQELITHISEKALKTLGINASKDRIIGEKIETIIKNLEIRNTDNNEILGTWKVDKRAIKVAYKVSDIVLDNQKISTLLSFDKIKDIIDIAINSKDSDCKDFSNIIGKSPELVKVIKKAKIAAQSDSSILLNGESGTGKELFARSIHNASRRKNKPFVAINCGAIPENLLESELFGYESGAFTGASLKGKIGKFELANNGTLFLDEIGDLPLHLQPKLLRVLQEKQIIRVGGNDPIQINVRIISATHRNLEELIQIKKFRHDLFYRLNVIPLELPSLRERENDVLLCCEYILQKLCQQMNINKKMLSKEVEKIFLLHDWPGNIRELENVIEYAANFSSGDEITLEDLPDYFFSRVNKITKEEKIDTYINMDGSLETITTVFEKNLLRKYLEIYGHSTQGKKTVSQKLGISLTTLYRKLHEYQ